MVNMVRRGLEWVNLGKVKHVRIEKIGNKNYVVRFVFHSDAVKWTDFTSVREIERLLEGK